MNTPVVRPVYILALMFLLIQAVCAAEFDNPWKQAVSEALVLRQQGDLRRSIDLLADIQNSAGTPEIKAAAAGELGITLLQAHRYDAAQAPLDRPTLFSQTASSAHATPSIWAIWRSPAGRWTKLNATTRKLWPWPAALLTFY